VLLVDEPEIAAAPDFIESWMAFKQSELKTELHVPSSLCAFFAYLIPVGAMEHAVYGILGSLRFCTGSVFRESVCHMALMLFPLS